MTSAGSVRSKRTPAERLARRRQIRGKTAKRLRRIARALKLSTRTAYAPGGRLRRRPSYRDAEGVLQPGAPIPRPGVLVECFRRAYKEAKKLYKGLPPSALMPEGETADSPFHVRVVDSMKKYYEAQN
jgi:hypothetical protein